MCEINLMEFKRTYKFLGKILTHRSHLSNDSKNSAVKKHRKISGSEQR
jgi:hypothetical protein